MNTVQMHSILRRLFGYAKHKARTVASSGLVRVAWLRTYLLIMYHGWSDNLIMPQGTTRYYERVKQTMGDVSDFSRLYMVGGMGHCSGGTNVDQFGQGSSGVVPREPTTDVFRALMAWSEKGVAPRELVASRIAAGVVTRTRPLCPYPQVAKYKGSGSTDEAANFSCTSP